MADTKGIRAGRAFVELGVNDQLTKGLAKAAKQLKAFGEGLKSIGKHLLGAGLGVLGFMAGAAKAFSEGTHELLEMSERTGVSVEALSELGFAAAQSGLDMEGLEKGLRKMEKTVGQAALGSDSANESLSRLGLTVADLIQLTPDRQFELIADRLSKIKDPTLRAALAMEIFGKSGTELLPLMQDGAKGIEELRKKAQELGLTVSTETAQQAALLHDALNALWMVGKKLYVTIGSALAPVFTALAEAATRTIVSATAWIREHKTIIITAFQVAAAVAGIGLALYATGTVITTTLSVLGSMKAAVMGVGAFLSALGSILAGLISPFGLIIAAIVALGGTLLVVTDAGANALQWLGTQFGALRDTVYKVMGGISDALAAGDIALAAQILWLALKLAWQQGAAALNQTWLTVKRFFVGAAYDMWYGALAAAEITLHALEIAWIETTAFLSETWTNFTAGFQQAWNSAINWTTKRILELQGLFDDTLDVEAAKKMADEDLASTNAEIEQRRQAAIAEREAKREGQRKQASQEHEDTLVEIGRQLDEAQRALEGETDAKVAETKRQLAEARQQLDEALAQARAKREAADKESGPPHRKAGDPLADLEDRLAQLGGLVAAKVSVTGTFNPAAVRELGASDVAQRTARATEETAKHTKKLADAAATGGLKFA